VTGSGQPQSERFLLPAGARRDLGRGDCLRLAMQRAFPLPRTGAFTDLLAEIDACSATKSTD
jgi:hypothetical protein